MFGLAIGYGARPTRCSSRDQKGSCFDTIGNNAMRPTMQCFNTLNTQRICPNALDFRAQRDETIGKITHFRLTSGVFNDRFALR